MLRLTYIIRAYNIHGRVMQLVYYTALNNHFRGITKISVLKDQRLMSAYRQKNQNFAKLYYSVYFDPSMQKIPILKNNK